MREWILATLRFYQALEQTEVWLGLVALGIAVIGLGWSMASTPVLLSGGFFVFLGVFHRFKFRQLERMGRDLDNT